MKASIYRTIDEVYLAILTGGQHIMRGNLADLASVLRNEGIAATDLLFGDWREGTSRFQPNQQQELLTLMLDEQLSEPESH